MRSHPHPNSPPRPLKGFSEVEIVLITLERTKSWRKSSIKWTLLHEASGTVRCNIKALFHTSKQIKWDIHLHFLYMIKYFKFSSILQSQPDSPLNKGTLSNDAFIPRIKIRILCEGIIHVLLYSYSYNSDFLQEEMKTPLKLNKMPTHLKVWNNWIVLV